MRIFFLRLALLALILPVIFSGCKDSSDPGNDESTETYTVTYNGNGNTGGSVPADSNTYEEGDTVTVLGNTGSLTLGENENTFSGWNTAAGGSGTEYTAGATFLMGTANVTLYAQWNGLPANYFQVRFTTDIDRSFGIGTSEDNIIIDSGLVVTGSTTEFFSAPAGDYAIYVYEGDNWFQNGVDIETFEAQKKYEVASNGLHGYWITIIP
jgi:hypothetical protein